MEKEFHNEIIESSFRVKYPDGKLKVDLEEYPILIFLPKLERSSEFGLTIIKNGNYRSKMTLVAEGCKVESKDFIIFYGEDRTIKLFFGNRHWTIGR
jgi:hypothetical protein